MAKAALNQQNKTIAQAFKEDLKMIFLALQPGYVAARLAGWKGEDDVDESVEGMYRVINGTTEAGAGLMFDHRGGKMEF